MKRTRKGTNKQDKGSYCVKLRKERMNEITSVIVGKKSSNNPLSRPSSVCSSRPEVDVEFASGGKKGSSSSSG